MTFVVIYNREYNVLKNFMKSQAHFASAQANRFIAMDLADPDIDFWRSPPQWACRHAGSTAPATSLGA